LIAQEERVLIAAVSEAEFDLSVAEGILARLGWTDRRDDGRDIAGQLIPLLQELQDAYGYLPPPVLTWVSSRTGIPTSRMYGVITFYAQFYTEPHGKHTIRCCRGTACHVRGGNKVINTMTSALGIEDGGTTKDMMFSFETVACLGACALAPLMTVDSTYYGKMTTSRAKQILHELRQKEDR
jgi:NADH-quinone oxidoreductase subunit E